MHFPESFDLAPRITFRDPLARLLEAVDDGISEYSSTGTAKLAGHSYPIIA